MPDSTKSWHAERAAYPDANIRGVQVQQMIRGGQEVILGVKRDPTFGPLIMFGGWVALTLRLWLTSASGWRR